MTPNILYEDNHIIVVYKERGILAQPDKTGDMDILSIVKTYLKEKYQKPGNVYLGLVHRLDRNTSGIMVLAKTSKAASRLSKQITNNEFTKRYLTVVEGKISKDDVLVSYLSKDEKALKAYINRSGKEAILSYHVLSCNDNESYLDIDLKTGRFHQIRAQLSSINHPLKGDKLYGSTYPKPYFLEAYLLSFYHPITKEELTFTTCSSDKISYISNHFN